MPSQSQTDSAEHIEVQQMDHNAPFRRSSLQYSARRLSSQKASYHTERKTLKPGKPVGKNVDDVVKYMSNVPSYLQRLEKGDNIQEKALNFGVLDWGRLEKWTHVQKQVVANSRGGGSPSSTISSSSASLSTFGSSSKSTRSADSPFLQMKQSPTLNAHVQNCVQHMNNPDSKTSHEGKIRYLNTKGNSIGKPRPVDLCSSSSSSKVDDIWGLAHDKVKSHIGIAKGEEKFHACQHECFSGNLDFAEDWLQDECLVVGGMWGHLQKSEHEGRTSYDSVTRNNEKSVEVSRKSFSGKFPTSEHHFTSQPPATFSCPLPSTDVKLGQLIEGLSEISAANMSEKPDEGKAKVGASTRRELSPHRVLNDGLNKIRSSTLGEEKSAVKQAIVSCENNSSLHCKCRRRSPPHRIQSGMSRLRDSSSREGSSEKEMKQTTCSSNSHEENATSSSRSKQSPLRGMLDSLVKLKNQIRVELKSEDEACKSSDANTNPFPLLQAEKQGMATRQALLKLAWKNELPLFVFSANDDDILAATMGKGSTSQTNEFNCSYTMFTAREIKKKGGLWMLQGRRRNNHDLFYTVVGQLRVSSTKSTSSSSNDYCDVREFVLLCSELAPTIHRCVKSPVNSELAAIVIKVPNERPETKCSIENLHIERENESSGLLANVIAILPDGIHGISSKGNPSPLIERWKSGGSCDCGGWDEGCILTILTDKIREGKSPGSSQACIADGIHRIELFPQVEDKENKHTFRMNAFKEGVYTVVYGTSIASVQAFAMCIAILHSKKPRTLPGIGYPIKCQSIASEKQPRSHVPIHPPLSPAGRA